MYLCSFFFCLYLVGKLYNSHCSVTDNTFLCNKSPMKLFGQVPRPAKIVVWKLYDYKKWKKSVFLLLTFSSRMLTTKIKCISAGTHFHDRIDKQQSAVTVRGSKPSDTSTQKTFACHVQRFAEACAQTEKCVGEWALWRTEGGVSVWVKVFRIINLHKSLVCIEL